MNKKTVAFLDLLGFSNYVKNNLHGANLLLINYHAVIDNMEINTRNKVNPDNSAVLLELESRLRTTSFDQFLPFSDSIVISANNPDLFIKQLSSFLLHCFKTNSNQFLNPEVPHNPTIVTSKNLDIRDQRLEMIDEKENWYPVLFRGGVSYNEYSEIISPAINDGEKVNFKNITGLSIVEAVKLEKKGKGPNIYLNKSFVDRLAQSSQKYILEIEEGFKLLWPSFIFMDQNDLKREINKFDELFISATNLWKAFNHESFGIHYFEFIKLIIESTFRIYREKGLENFAKKYISKKIEEENIPKKKQVLLNQFT